VSPCLKALAESVQVLSFVAYQGPDMGGTRQGLSLATVHRGVTWESTEVSQGCRGGVMGVSRVWRMRT
jgi:hypothetical protein